MGNLRRVHSGELRCLFVCLFVGLNKYSADEIKENKMDETCGTHGGENNTGFRWGYLNLRATWKTRAWIEG